MEMPEASGEKNHSTFLRLHVLYIVAAVLLFGVGVFIGIEIRSVKKNANISTQEAFSATAYESHFGQIRLVNPLLECEIGQEFLSKSLVPFKKTIEDFIPQVIAAKRARYISFYFRDMNNGPWFGINEKENFSPASLLKVPLMMTVLRETSSNPKIGEKKIRFEGEGDTRDQYFKSKNIITSGGAYSIEQLVTSMIRSSDNTAALLLRGYIGEKAYEQTYSDLGMPIAKGDEDSISVKDYASFFRVLFNASYLSIKPSEYALELLSKTEFNSGIVDGVPDGIVVAHKFGERSQKDTGLNQLHDCGIIYYPKHPYLLCIMTRGDSFDELARVISDLSSLTYSSVDKQFK
jgi:beta-lactamase class A